MLRLVFDTAALRVSIVRTDTCLGIGVAPEHTRRIFEIFQRLHSDDTYPGTCIGLAIVQKAVEKMGGQVRVESQVGTGSNSGLNCPTNRVVQPK